MWQGCRALDGLTRPEWPGLHNGPRRDGREQAAVDLKAGQLSTACLSASCRLLAASLRRIPPADPQALNPRPPTTHLLALDRPPTPTPTLFTPNPRP